MDLREKEEKKEKREKEKGPDPGTCNRGGPSGRGAAPRVARPIGKRAKGANEEWATPP